MRVAIAEDEALFRDGIAVLLGEVGHNVVHCVPDGQTLAERLAADPVDVAVLDIRMPPEPDGGLVIAARLREKHPTMGLLLLSHYAETHYLKRILKIDSGRIGYRLKGKIASVSALSDTLTRIAEGEIVVEPALVARLIGRPQGRKGRLAALSERETDVLRLMAEGRSNHGIAACLDLSARTVERHVASVFDKLGLPPDSTVYHRRVLAVLAYLRPEQPET